MSVTTILVFGQKMLPEKVALDVPAGDHRARSLDPRRALVASRAQLTDVGNTVPGHSTEEAGQASIAVRPPWCDC
jgi:hypothetical protein